MKTLKIATALLIALCSMSCLEHGFDDIETYTGNDILGVAGVYYRYYGNDTNPGSGETKVSQVTMSSNAKIDEENATVVCSWSHYDGLLFCYYGVGRCLRVRVVQEQHHESTRYGRRQGA